MWLTVGNALSAARLVTGLAFAGLPESWRPAAVALAALSDGLDGVLSRATHTAGAVGRTLDPVADKVFVAGVLGTLVADGMLTVTQIGLLALRDVAVLARAVWVAARRDWAAARGYRATRLGKLTTALQFLTLLAVLLIGRAETALLLPAAVVGGLAALDYLVRPVNAPPAPPVWHGPGAPPGRTDTPRR